MRDEKVFTDAMKDTVHQTDLSKQMDVSPGGSRRDPQWPNGSLWCGEVHPCSFAEARRLAQTGEIVDSMTILAVRQAADLRTHTWQL